jgi:hypothetical protein
VLLKSPTKENENLKTLKIARAKKQGGR